MEATVRQYVSQCQICKKSKIPNKKYGLLPETDIQCDPWEIIQIDLFGPWTFEDIDHIAHQIQGLSIIDVAMRWVELCPHNFKRSEDIALLVDQNWFAVTHVLILQFLTMVPSSHLSFWNYYVATVEFSTVLASGKS
jgi:hypothetical protein